MPSEKHTRALPNRHTCVPGHCFSGPPVYQQYLGSHQKCQISGPIPDLVAQSLPCNELSRLFYTHYHLKSTDIGNIPFVCLPIYID